MKKMRHELQGVADERSIATSHIVLRAMRTLVDLLGQRRIYLSYS